MKKWLDNLITGILGGFIVLLLGAEISMMVTEKKNGIPSLFGYSFLYVKTDSMVGDNPDSLAVGDGIVIKHFDPEDVQVGQVITFLDMECKGATPTEQIVTHRVMDIDRTDPNDLIFFCFGDNPESHYNVSTVLTYPEVANVVHQQYYKGTLVTHSPNFGAFILSTQQTWFMPVTVFIPLGLIAIWEGIDAFREGRKEEKELQKEVAEAMAAAGIDPKDERSRLLYEEKFRYKVELKHEIEEALAREKAKFEKEFDRAKKDEKARLKKEREALGK